jgi:hypothetical protein
MRYALALLLLASSALAQEQWKELIPKETIGLELNAANAWLFKVPRTTERWRVRVEIESSAPVSFGFAKELFDVRQPVLKINQLIGAYWGTFDDWDKMPCGRRKVYEVTVECEVTAAHPKFVLRDARGLGAVLALATLSGAAIDNATNANRISVRFLETCNTDCSSPPKLRRTN